MTAAGSSPLVFYGPLYRRARWSDDDAVGACDRHGWPQRASTESCLEIGPLSRIIAAFARDACA